MIGHRHFTRDRRGRFHPGLSEEERQLLERLPSEALALLNTEDPSTRRLFPVAYPDDPAAEGEYRALVGESLLARHRRALDTLAEGARAETLDREELEQWMGAIEVLRLVLGTQLDVQEDMEPFDRSHPEAAGLALYTYLSMLQEEIVDALSSHLSSTGPR